MEASERLWGRKTEATWATAAGSLFLVSMCPVWIIANWITLEYFGGSLFAFFSALSSDGLIHFTQQYVPRSSMRATVGYASWLLFQATLYSLLPGPLSTGQLTPAGNLLKYKTNGLLAWVVTHLLTVLAATFGFLDLAVIANHWEGLLVAVNVYGVLLAAFCLVKAHVMPSHPNDRKFSGWVRCSAIANLWLTCSRLPDIRLLRWYRAESTLWRVMGFQIVPQWTTGHNCLDFNVGFLLELCRHRLAAVLLRQSLR